MSSSSDYGKTYDKDSREKVPAGVLKRVDRHCVDVLRKFISPEGKILPRRRTGLSAKQQRCVCRNIKRARCICRLPFVCRDV